MRLFSGVLLPLLLLLLTCQLATPTPIFDRDGTGRSAGFGETVRDWFKMLKDRIVGKWQEWFGGDGPSPSLSPQDILNIDKNIQSRVSGYPGFFLDLFTDSYGDSDSDEWDLKPLFPGLPTPSWVDWTPDFRRLPTEIPGTTQSPTTTPRQTTVTPTQSVLTSTESTVPTTEVTSTESSPLTTQLITTSTEPIVTSTEEILTPSESVVVNSEPAAAPTESMLTSTEAITEPTTVPSIESTIHSIEPIPSVDNEPISVESIETSESIESTEVMTPTDELTTITTTTESPVTSTEILPFNKRVEENETVDKRTTKKPRPASAEVITF
ncbi:PREDICTED: zonadhesin-like isoform X2 [Wasmannia auropunctata]|uniref:zonadhesin-like isoform X2 n=1 Tax=Wasmannia auropunctata TaxID=64793 RepID=UPI0005EF58BC|nr:PREDICTED: zonadhesin-like isoform X2 [Wasmannia auropunctata]